MKRVVVIGARRRRQGTGEFVAYWFTRAGACVCAIVGTQQHTVAQACRDLQQRYDIDCRGYTCVRTALVEERPDIVAICSPYIYHLEHLQIVADFGIPCLCEKPLWWSDSPNYLAQMTTLIDAFARKKCYLQLITQWPYTIPSFYQLYPQLKMQPLQNFAMTLSPISQGADMIVDAAPHPISMLQSLVGSGQIRNVRCRLEHQQQRMQLEFAFHHRYGITNVNCLFIRVVQPPRPACYAINGYEIRREIQLPEYAISFNNDHKSVIVEDPLGLLIADFLDNVDSRKIERQLLIDSISNLQTLFLAAV